LLTNILNKQHEAQIWQELSSQCSVWIHQYMCGSSSSTW